MTAFIAPGNDIIVLFVALMAMAVITGVPILLVFLAVRAIVRRRQARQAEATE